MCKTTPNHANFEMQRYKKYFKTYGFGRIMSKIFVYQIVYFYLHEIEYFTFPKTMVTKVCCKQDP